MNKENQNYFYFLKLFVLFNVIEFFYKNFLIEDIINFILVIINVIWGIQLVFMFVFVWVIILVVFVGLLLLVVLVFVMYRMGFFKWVWLF